MKQVWERNKVELESLLESYPWFTSARRARALLTGERDAALTLPTMFWPTVPPETERTTVTSPTPPVAPAAKQPTKQPPATQTVSTDDQIITRFLEHGAYRINPDEDADVAEAVTEERFDASEGELATEELAAIYLSQGLAEEAKKIYRELSLRNPEKSIYFADIISRIDK